MTVFLALSISILLSGSLASGETRAHCEKPGPADSFKNLVPCAGSNVFLSDPKDCASCAISENSAREQKKINEYEAFFENRTVTIHDGYAFVDNAFVGAATCLDNKTETLGYVEYVRRRSNCSGLSPESVKSQKASLRESSKKSALSDLEDIGELNPEAKSRLIESQTKQMNKFIRDHGCQKGARLTLQGSRPIRSSKTFARGNDLAEVKRLSEPQIGEERNRMLQMREKGGFFCTKDPVFETDSETTTITTYEASIKATEFFDNNKAQLKNADGLKADIERQLAEMKKKHGNCMGRLKSVELMASANKIRNGEPWDPWDFKSLSQARADALLRDVLPKVDHPDFKDRDWSKTKVSLGDGGSGASGPCPYILAETKQGSGIYRLERSLKSASPEEIQAYEKDPESLTPEQADRVKLEQAKNVRISMHFEASPDCVNSVPQSKYVGKLVMYGCLRPDFECIK
jgi:hypothetical protein